MIYSLTLDITPPPGVGPQLHCQLIVPLDRAGDSCGRNGRPRPPKVHSIDLRVGDNVIVEGTWRKVLAIEAYREHWLTEEEAAISGAGARLRVMRPRVRIEAMTLAERRTAAIRLLADLDQTEREATEIAQNRANLWHERLRAMAYRRFFRMAQQRTEQLLALLESKS